MQTLLQLLTELETLAKHAAPVAAPIIEPIVLAGLEALKGRFTSPVEVDLIDAAERLIVSYFPPPPSSGT